MAYIEGFVIALQPPTGRRSSTMPANWTRSSSNTAPRVVECWGDDVPHGKQTDFHRAVAARADEVAVFSWIEWPDKATRDAGMKKMMEDPRMDPNNPMPFDGKRLIYGGFEPIVELSA